jgi:hypothetical protein
MKDLHTRTRVTALIGLAALIVIIIYSIAPNASVITNKESTELYGVDIFGLTKNAGDLPVEQYAAH